jgi:hypothetical protein
LMRLAADSQTKLPQSLLDNLFQLFGLHARYVDLRQGSNDGLVIADLILDGVGDADQDERYGHRVVRQRLDGVRE